MCTRPPPTELLCALHSLLILASRDVGRELVRFAACALPSLALFVFWRLLSSLPHSFVHPSRSISPSFSLSHALFVQRSVHPTPRSRAQLLPPSITLTFCRPFFPPPLVSSIVLRSASLQLASLGHGAVAGQFHLALLM